MEQPLDLALPLLESISPPESSSHCERNHIEGGPAAANITSIIQPVLSTPEYSKNEIPQVMEGIGPVANMVAGCCCRPSPVRVAELPKEKQPLSRATCGCSTGEAQKCTENIVKTTDCCLVETKGTLTSQTMPNGGKYS